MTKASLNVVPVTLYHGGRPAVQMVRLLVRRSGGSALEWLVVRFRGERDGVKGQRGFVRLSSESSPLPLTMKVRGEHATLALQRYHCKASTARLALQDQHFNVSHLVQHLVQRPPSWLISGWCSKHIWRPSDLPRQLRTGPLLLHHNKHFIQVFVPQRSNRRIGNFSIPLLTLPSTGRDLLSVCLRGRHGNLPTLPRKSHRCPGYSSDEQGPAFT